MAEVKSETRLDIEKYERELKEVNKKLEELDGQRGQVVRVGVRIEGIIAYLRNKEQEQLAAVAKAPDAEPASTPA